MGSGHASAGVLWFGYARAPPISKAFDRVARRSDDQLRGSLRARARDHRQLGCATTTQHRWCVDEHRRRWRPRRGWQAWHRWRSRNPADLWQLGRTASTNGSAPFEHAPHLGQLGAATQAAADRWRKATHQRALSRSPRLPRASAFNLASAAHARDDVTFGGALTAHTRHRVAWIGMVAERRAHRAVALRAGGRGFRSLRRPGHQTCVRRERVGAHSKGGATASAVAGVARVVGGDAVTVVLTAPIARDIDGTSARARRASSRACSRSPTRKRGPRTTNAAAATGRVVLISATSASEKAQQANRRKRENQ